MGRVIYAERVFSRWITLILGAVTLVMLWQVIQQLQGSAPVDDGPTWLRPFILILFALVTANFAWLTIRVTDEEVVVAYGVIRRRIRWEDIENCYRDKASATWYGGYGIRIGWYEGKRRLIFNTIGDPRVVLLTRSTSTPEFVFSTAQPDDVVNRVNEHLRSLKR